MGKLTQDEITRVKALGFLLNRGTENFSGRILPGNGVMSAEGMKKVAECAEKFGSGQVSMTSRLTLELPGIPYENIEPARAFMAEAGLEFGGTGAKIRPVTACKGTTCVFGNCDTQGMAMEIHHTYFEGWKEVKLPHKFKIAVGGCPNSCMKPDLNDFGVEGRRTPKYDVEKCRSCTKCQVELSCPIKVVSRREDGKIAINWDACNSCGVCSSGKCPFGAVAKHEDVQYQIYIGGTWGKKTRNGTALSRFVEKDEIFPLLEKTMLWFKENAYQKERLGAAIDRIGLDKMEAELFGDDLLKRKEEILAAPIKQRP